MFTYSSVTWGIRQSKVFFRGSCQEASVNSQLSKFPGTEDLPWLRNSPQKAANFDLEKFPSLETVFSILQECRTSKDLKHSHHLHASLCSDGLDTLGALGNHLVPLFVDCRSLDHATRLFRLLSHKNAHTWSSLMMGYVNSGSPHCVFDLHEDMEKCYIHPNNFIMVALINASAKVKDMDRGWKIYVEVILRGFEMDLYITSGLVDLHAKSGYLLEAQNVFAKLQNKSVVLWNTLIGGFSEYDHAQSVMMCYKQMYEENIPPDNVTFIFVLKACSNIRDIDTGRIIHGDAVKLGYENHFEVSSTLVDTYAKCGSLEEAQEMFDKLDSDLVSWTSLIVGYTEHGFGQRALQCFANMRLGGVVPDVAVYTCALKACANTLDLRKGQEIYAGIVCQGLETDSLVVSACVDVYTKCVCLEDAGVVFDGLSVKENISLDALIAQCGSQKVALQYVYCRLSEGVCLSSVAWISLLKYCAFSACGLDGLLANMGIIQRGIETDEFVGNTLVDMYAKYGFLREAQSVFDKQCARNVVSSTALINGYADHGCHQQVLSCFERMQLEGLCPDATMYVSVLKACATVGAIERGKYFHKEVRRRGIESNVFVGNALIDMYASHGLLEEAQEVFDKLCGRSIVVWTSLIAGYAEFGPEHQAIILFEQMLKEGCLLPDEPLCACVVKACGGVAAGDKGQEYHAYIVKKGFDNDAVVGTTLVDMYVKCSLLVDAQVVFNKLASKNVVSCNAMVKGYGLNHLGDKAIELYETMKDIGVKPDEITFMCLLSTCSRTNSMMVGQCAFHALRKCDIVPTLEHFTCLVNTFARSGWLLDAFKLLGSIPCAPSKEMCRTLISACKTHMDAGLGLECFHQLILLNHSENV